MRFFNDTKLFFVAPAHLLLIHKITFAINDIKLSDCPFVRNKLRISDV